MDTADPEERFKSCRDELNRFADLAWNIIVSLSNIAGFGRKTKRSLISTKMPHLVTSCREAFLK